MKKLGINRELPWFVYRFPILADLCFVIFDSILETDCRCIAGVNMTLRSWPHVSLACVHVCVFVPSDLGVHIFFHCPVFKLCSSFTTGFYNYWGTLWRCYPSADTHIHAFIFNFHFAPVFIKSPCRVFQHRQDHNHCASFVFNNQTLSSVNIPLWKGGIPLQFNFGLAA